MPLYRLLDRLFPNSFTAKLVFVAFVGIHVPLIATLAWLALRPAGTPAGSGLIAVLAGATLAGTLATLVALRAVLRPLYRIESALARFDADATPTDLPQDHRDQLGRLMRRCNELTRHMGQRIAEKTVEAETDPLTGVLNRRGFDRRLRDRAEGAVVLLDLDGFKAVNDRIGHAAGDRLLCAVARQLAAALRQGNVLARLGGDEFAVWLPGAAEAEARAVAGRLRAAVAGLPQDSGAPVTLSSGVAVTRPGRTLAETLETADRALRRAKTGDRNRPAPGPAAGHTPTCRD